MVKRRGMWSVVCGMLLLIFASSSFADMTLDREKSSLNFVSIKKGAAGETHIIKKLSGSLSDGGDLKVTLHMNSVDTKIPIRDERMNRELFESEKYPEAILTAKVDEDLSSDGMKTLQTEASLDMHGVSQKLMVDVMVVRNGDQLIASSIKPVIISAPDFNMGEGIARLMKLAKLPSIATAVPVNFVLVFNKK